MVRKPWPVEHVKVVAVKTKNKGEVEIGREFEEEDDWLDGLTLTIANNYDKTVTALTIEWASAGSWAIPDRRWPIRSILDLVLGVETTCAGIQVR